MFKAESTDKGIVISIDPNSKDDVMSAASTVFAYILMRDPASVSQCCIYNFMSTIFYDDQQRAIDSLVAGRAALFNSPVAKHAATLVSTINNRAEMNAHRETITFMIGPDGELSVGH